MSSRRTALVAVAAASLLACGGDGGSEPPPPVVALRVTPGTASLRMGETVQLAAGAVTSDGTAGALPAGTAVAWASEDTTIAVVNATGQARAVRAGTVALRATAGAVTGATTATVRAATPQLATAARATARIGAAGGRLTTTSGGQRYVLTIPAGALRDSTEISLTPLSGMTDLPDGATLLAGADFAPAGLVFAVPALLRVEGIASSGRLSGFAYGAATATFGRAAASRGGDTLVMVVAHFSGAGAVTTIDASTIPPPLNSTAGATAFLVVDALASAGRESGTFDVPAIAAAMHAWFTDVVRPGLQSASTDAALVEALGIYGIWHWLLECGGSSTCVGGVMGSGGINLWPAAVGFELQGALAGTIDEASGAVVAALTAGIARSNATCVAQRDLVAAKNVLYYQTVAERYTVATGSLAPDAVLDGLCVKIVIESVSVAAVLESGAATPARIVAGISFGGAAPVHAPPLFVEGYVTAGGTTTYLPGAFTDASGAAGLTFTPGGTGEVELKFIAEIVDHDLFLSGVVHDTTITRELTVGVALTPTAAILDRGAAATFTAAVTGTTSTAVTWSASGGTFTVAGNTLTYLAGSAPGTYAVTARSVADPTKSATAPVTIVGAADGGVLTVTRIEGRAQAELFLSLARTCVKTDPIPVTTPPPASFDVAATCTGTGTSRNGNPLAATGDASESGGITRSGGRVTSITASARAEATATGETIEEGFADAAIGAAAANLVLDFEVTGGDVIVTLSGVLAAEIPDPTSSSNARASLIFRPDLGGAARFLDRTVGRSSGSETVEPPASLALTQRLAPGGYRILVFAEADANATKDHPGARATGRYAFTLTVAAP